MHLLFNKLSFVIILLLISILSWIPSFGQIDSLGLKILSKTADKYRKIKSISFQYQLSTLFLDDSLQWEDSQNNNGIANLTLKTNAETKGLKDKKPEFVFANQKNSNQDPEIILEFNASLNALWSALENKNCKLITSCGDFPFFIVQLETENWSTKSGTKNSNLKTLYIDTVSYIIRSYSQSSSGSSSILRSFSLSSIKINTNQGKASPKPFQLNRNMLQAGEMAPEFSLKDSDGNQVKLSDYSGKLVLLDFWYAACKPCIKASFHLEELQNKYANRGLVVLGMNTMDKADKIRKHNKKHNITYNSVLCPRDLKTSYKIVSYPSFYLVDTNGKIVFSTSGYYSGLEKDLELAILQALSNR